MKTASETPPERACRVAGGQVELAKKLTAIGRRISPQAIHQWVKRGVVPPGAVLDVEAVTGIPRHELRADRYPPPVKARARARRAALAAS